VGSFRYATPATKPAAADYLASRWRGQPGRLEVWYTTLTDPSTGTGVWLHHELVAPSAGDPAHVHGFAVVFPPDGTPVLGRFGPYDHEPDGDGRVFAAGDVAVTADRLYGKADGIAWDLTVAGGGEPLFTFPRWAWDRELLPAAQIVPAPTAVFDGVVRYGDRELTLRQARGGNARIYGHGNARRWAWLHADLGGGDVLEIISAVSMRPVLRALPPLTFLRLRLGGTDWPSGDTLLAAPRFRARIGLPTWTVTGGAGDRRIHVEVVQPAERTVAVAYSDPDGAPATCHNSERADAVIRLERRDADGRWTPEREWRLDGTAHAEVGTRE
jgi:hypothetical protein